MNKNFITIIFSSILLLLISNNEKIFSAAIIRGSSTESKKSVVPQKDPSDLNELDLKLYQAVENNNKEEIVRLLNLGANFLKRNYNTGLTSYLLSYEKHSTDPSYYEIIDLFNKTINFDEDMQSAMIRGNLKEIDSLLNKGARVNGIDEIGAYSNLMNAVSRSYKDIVKLLLLTNRANIDYRNRVGKTALHLAIEQGDKGITELLLEYGADVNIPDDWGDTPLMVAATQCNANIVKLLIEKKADINTTNKKGISAINKASFGIRNFSDYHPRKAECFKIIKLLAKNGADINATDLDDFSPLMRAADFGEAEIVKFLLAAGADFNFRGYQNMNALELAQHQYDQTRFRKIVEMLKSEKLRREKVIADWNKLHNKEIAKKIQDSTGIIPEISSIIANYAQTDNYEDLPLEYRFASIRE